MGEPEPAVLERVAVELAEGAAEVVRHGRAAQLEVAAKSTATDLVTQVDRASERWLVEQLAVRRPGDGVLGEEGGARVGRSSVRWLLDPIDGTVNFVLGLPQYAVSVAAELAGEIVAGAVCNPATGECFRAHLGGGAYLADTRLTGPRDVPLSRAIVATGFGYDAALRARQAAVVGALLPQIADVRRLGAASLDLCALAAGRIDAYFEAGLNAWDFAAGGLIAREAGCVVTGSDGAPPSERLVAAAGAGLASEFFRLLDSLDAAGVSS